MTDKLFTKRLRELTDEAIRESLAEISVEFQRRFGSPPADAILALTPVEGVGEPVGWQYAIMCPIKHEKRWIYALCPTEDDARRSGQRHDPDTGALLEDAPDVRPLYATLSTPVAQGDEVRGALSTAFDIVDAAPELNMSNYDHSDVDALNSAMIEVHQFLRATLTKGARDAG